MGEDKAEVAFGAFRFASASAAKAAVDDLQKWVDRRDKDLSAYRLAHRQDTVAICSIVLQNVEAAGKRLRRRNGEPIQLPDEEVHALIDRTINAGLRGVSGRREYELALPFGSPGDPSLN